MVAVMLSSCIGSPRSGVRLATELSSPSKLFQERESPIPAAATPPSPSRRISLSLSTPSAPAANRCVALSVSTPAIAVEPPTSPSTPHFTNASKVAFSPSENTPPGHANSGNSEDTILRLQAELIGIKRRLSETTNELSEARSKLARLTADRSVLVTMSIDELKSLCGTIFSHQSTVLCTMQARLRLERTRQRVAAERKAAAAEGSPPARAAPASPAVRRAAASPVRAAPASPARAGAASPIAVSSSSASPPAAPAVSVVSSMKEFDAAARPSASAPAPSTDAAEAEAQEAAVALACAAMEARKCKAVAAAAAAAAAVEAAAAATEAKAEAAGRTSVDREVPVLA
eukprot:tig00000215_g18674.t1